MRDVFFWSSVFFSPIFLKRIAKEKKKLCQLQVQGSCWKISRETEKKKYLRLFFFFFFCRWQRGLLSNIFREVCRNALIHKLDRSHHYCHSIFSNNYVHVHCLLRSQAERINRQYSEKESKKERKRRKKKRVPEERLCVCVHGDWQHNGAYLH